MTRWPLSHEATVRALDPAILSLSGARDVARRLWSTRGPWFPHWHWRTTDRIAGLRQLHAEAGREAVALAAELADLRDRQRAIAMFVDVLDAAIAEAAP